MSGVKLDIIWSPIHADRFITVGTEIILYEIENIKSSSQKPSSINISETEHASVLCINSEYSYLKCVSWYPKCTSDLLLAVGLASGKVVITSLGQHSQESQRFVGREFAPKQPRQCNGIAWNHTESNLLACGLEKNRSDHSLLVWDINRPPIYHSNVSNTLNNQHSPYQTITHASGISSADVVNSLARSQTVPTTYSTYYPESASSMMNKPLIEHALGETVHSLQWFLHQPKTLVIGNNNKSLKIFDLRDTTPFKHHNSTPTKAVYGVCTDPFYEHRLASFIDNQVLIWDIRNFEKPVLTLTESKQVSKLSWCPTRSNLLSSLAKDSSVVNLYDIQSMNVSQEEIEPAIIERSIQPHNQAVVLSFSWHPTQENRMLSISPVGNIRNVTVSDRISVAWLPSTHLVWSNGAELIIENDKSKHIKNIDDISITMKKRAIQGYGVKLEQLWQNSELTEDPKLVNLWNWLDTVKCLSEDVKSTNNTTANKWPTWYTGIHSLVCNGGHPCNNVNTISLNSDLVSVQWIGVDGPLLSPSVKIYKSASRDQAFQLCGWGNNRDDISFNLFLDNLVADGEYERAATIAVFNLKIREAIQILDKGSTDKKTIGGLNLNIVAMALSGYTEEKQTLWREMCDSLRTKLGNPYLSAMFAFLTANDYNDILNEEGIIVKDRVAFACIFLSDSKLTEYINQLNKKLIESGDLDGILLTGFTQSGMDLLQNYVDVTGDVQTVSLIMQQILSVEPIKDPRAIRWIDSYCDLLDQWRLWHQRAIFDVQYHKQDVGNRPAQQVSVSCNFCGKSISAHVHAMTQARVRPLVGLHGPSANRNKVSCCPGCRKPLPRCALCLINMGTPSGSFKPKKNNAEEEEKKRSQFSNWFTWCQTCRHGGHADHMTEWFRLHKECPVTACTCKCLCLDSISKPNQSNIDNAVI